MILSPCLSNGTKVSPKKWLTSWFEGFILMTTINLEPQKLLKLFEYKDVSGAELKLSVTLEFNLIYKYYYL